MPDRIAGWPELFAEERRGSSSNEKAPRRSGGLSKFRVYDLVLVVTEPSTATVSTAIESTTVTAAIVAATVVATTVSTAASAAITTAAAASAAVSTTVATAAAVAAAITTTTTTVSTAVTTTAEAGAITFGTRACFVHDQIAAVEALTVGAFDGSTAGLVIGHFNEPEAAATIRDFVHDDLGRSDLSERSEKLVEILVLY